jgi:hypothetical protein
MLTRSAEPPSRAALAAARAAERGAQVLETTREENLAMIRDTVRYLKALDKEVGLRAHPIPPQRFDSPRAPAPAAPRGAAGRAHSRAGRR